MNTPTTSQGTAVLELITDPRTVQFIGRPSDESASSCSNGDEPCDSDCGSGDGSDAC
jgi:hypothetical protein